MLKNYSSDEEWAKRLLELYPETFKFPEDIPDMAERREDAIKTEKSALYHAGIAGEARGIVKSRAEGEAIGIVKGRAEGEARGIEKMVAGMRAAGFTEEQIEAIRKTAR